MRQGQGKSTSRKQRGLAAVFRQGLRISRAIPWSPYWHIDLNAGCGHNAVAGCPGSPVTFLNEAIRAGRRVNAVFCDNDPAAARALSGSLFFAAERLPDGSTVSVVERDNAVALREFAARIRSEERHPQFAVGSWLLDPNGFKAEDVPLDALMRFCEQFPRIDAILNLNLSLFARVSGCRGRKTPNGVPWGFDDWPGLSDVCGLKRLKSHWLVRNPSFGGGGCDRFVLFLGRNTAAGMARFGDFVPLDSENGRLVVEHFKRFRPDQPAFPGWED
jgi:three-Cys-motif partner protein